MISTASRSSGSQPAARLPAAPSSAPASSSSALARRYRTSPVGGQMGLAADHLEDLHAQERFDFLHGVGDGGLALVQRGGGLRIAAGVDHGQQRAPLFQGNPRVGIIYPIKLII